MKNVLFLNENTLGHSSYLPRFVEEISRRPDLRVKPYRVDVCPLPEALEAACQDRIRGAVRLGFSTLYRRWREVAGQHAASLCSKSLSELPLQAIVVNTQSVALDLPKVVPTSLPMAVCLDATFTELRRTPWFAPNSLSKLLQPLTIGDLIEKEAALFERADILFPWSQRSALSLHEDYGVPKSKIEVLPPSLELPLSAARTQTNRLPRLLFMGGDFRRKGGPLLVDCYQKYFRGRAELDIVTQTEAPEGDGIRVWKNISANSEPWQRLWRQADLFVFPSHLETFGIVLLEAHAHSVPIVSSSAGAAAEILENGEAGWLLNHLDIPSLAAALEEALEAPALRTAKSERGHSLIEARFLLARNTTRLTQRILALTGGGTATEL